MMGWCRCCCWWWREWTRIFYNWKHDSTRLHGTLPHHHPGQTNTKIAAGSCTRVDDGLKMDLWKGNDSKRRVLKTAFLDKRLIFVKASIVKGGSLKRHLFQRTCWSDVTAMNRKWDKIEFGRIKNFCPRKPLLFESWGSEESREKILMTVKRKE